MDSKAGFLIWVPEGPINTSIEFVGIRDFLNWCNQQQDFLRDINVSQPVKSKILPRFIESFERFQNAANEPDFDPAKLNAIIQEEVQRGILTLDSTAGKLLRNQMANAYVKIGLLAGLADHDILKAIEYAPGSEGEIIQGFSVAKSLFDVGSMRASDVAEKQQQRLAEVTLEMEETVKLLENSKKAMIAQGNSFVQKTEEFASEQERIVKSYEEALTLDVAKEYWQGKFARHDDMSNEQLASFRKWAFGGCAFIAVGSVASGWIYLNTTTSFGRIVTNISSLPFGVSVALALFLFLPVFIYVWHLRTLHAGAKMHRHYAEDATMRSTMMVVYLALMKQNKEAVTQDERALLLNAILRPLEGGQKDDGPPPGLVELLTRSN